MMVPEKANGIFQNLGKIGELKRDGRGERPFQPNKPLATRINLVTKDTLQGPRSLLALPYSCHPRRSNRLPAYQQLEPISSEISWPTSF